MSVSILNTYLKKINTRCRFSAAVILWFGICQGAFAAQPNVRLEMEQETRQEVAIAVPEFVLKKNTRDRSGLHREARQILQNDLRLSELFILVSPIVYEELEKMERGKEKVDKARA